MKKSLLLALLALFVAYGAAMANLPPVGEPRGGTIPPGGTIPVSPGFVLYLPLISK